MKCIYVEYFSDQPRIHPYLTIKTLPVHQTLLWCLGPYFYEGISFLELLTLTPFKVKLKCTVVQALRLCTDRRAHRGSRGIALLFLDHSNRRGWGTASLPGRSLPPGKTRNPLYRRLVGTKGRCGQVWKILPPPGFDPRTKAVKFQENWPVFSATSKSIICLMWQNVSTWKDYF